MATKTAPTRPDQSSAPARRIKVPAVLVNLNYATAVMFGAIMILGLLFLWADVRVEWVRPVHVGIAVCVFAGSVAVNILTMYLANRYVDDIQR